MAFLDGLKAFGKGALRFLPALAGGPAGPLIQSLVSDALGVDDDESAVLEALKNDPEALVKLKKLESDERIRLKELAIEQGKLAIQEKQAEAEQRKAELAAETAQHSTVNETIRAELETKDRFKSYWRPMFGYVYTLSWLLLMLAVSYSIAFKPDTAVQAINAVTALQPILGVGLVVLGVVASKRSQDKQASLGVQPNGIMSAIATRIKNGGGHHGE